MLKLVSENNSIHDPLVSCIETVLKFHTVQTDLAGIVAELPKSGPVCSMADLPALADHLDLTLKIISSDIEEIKKILTPCILPLSENHYAVVIPVDGGQHNILIPGQAPTPLTDEHLESWVVGRIIMLVPKPTSRINKKHSLDWFWHPVKNYLPNFGEAILFTAFINLLVIAMPLFVWSVYDSLALDSAVTSLALLAAGVGFAIVFDVFLKTARSSTLELIAARTAIRFDIALMHRMLGIKEEQMRLTVGERCNLFRELQGIRDFYAKQLVPACVDLPFILFFLIIIFLISPVLVLVPIGISVAILLLNMVIRVPLKRSTHALSSSMQNKSSTMVELLAGSSDIKQLNASVTSLRRWNFATDQASEATRISSSWLTFAEHASKGLTQLNHVFMVVVGVYQIQAGLLTVGGLIAATILGSRTIAPIMNLPIVFARWTQSRFSMEVIDKLFTREVDRVAIEVNPTPSLDGAIEIRNFSFNYPDRPRAAVKSVNISIKAGEHLCLLGPSGAGKSTLARAILGALTPTEGQISIDGYDYQTMSAARLRENIAVIPQHPFFVAGSLKDNLLLGITQYTDEAITNATRLAGLDMVLTDSCSLDMEVGENGRHLTGGQKQAVSIARAILRDTPVLVLDEPTNGLDSELEVHFMNTMKEFTRGRTLLIVTHQMSLLSLVDRVIVMDKGFVVADDKSESVLKRFSA